MMNIFHADLYRLRHGAAMRNTIIGLLLTIVFIGVTLFAFTSDGLAIYLDEGIEQAAASDELQGMDVQGELAQMQEQLPHNAAEFVQEMLASDMMPFFILAVVVTVFCADFSAGTYRNTLSYESSRTKVYLGKLLLSVCCLLLLNLVLVLFSWLLGGVLFGFGGFTAAYLIQILTAVALIFPVSLGITALIHCLVAYTRKSSSTVAVYLIGLMVITMVLQLVSSLRGMGWIIHLDPFSAGKILGRYWEASPGSIAVTCGLGLAIAAASTALGVVRFNKTDMA